MSSKKFCTNCGEELTSTSEAKYCPKCGIKIDRDLTKTNSNDTKEFHANEPSVVTQLPYKSPGTAALIAFIGGIFGLPGIGHIYVGKLGKGIGILILGLVLYAITVISLFGIPPAAILFSIGYLIIWIWQIFNARSEARRFNQLVKETGKEPW